MEKSATLENPVQFFLDKSLFLQEGEVNSLEDTILEILAFEGDSLPDRMILVDILLGLLSLYLGEIFALDAFKFDRKEVFDKYLQKIKENDFAMLRKISKATKPVFGGRKPVLALFEVASKGYKNPAKFPPSPNVLYYGFIGKWLLTLLLGKPRRPSFKTEDCKKVDEILSKFIVEKIQVGFLKNGWKGLSQSLRGSWAWASIWTAHIMVLTSQKAKKFEIEEAIHNSIKDVEAKMKKDPDLNNNVFLQLIEKHHFINHVLTAYINKKFFVPSLLQRTEI